MGRTKKQSNKAIRRIICKTGLEQISTNTVIRNAGLKKEVSRLKKESEDKTETINGLNDENFELKNQVKNLEYNGSHRVSHVTRPRQ
uniref:Transposase n=1 Tax=Rhabditophanes sp. KR3021 TaxID=114890 RepID=A0AC35TLE2_9BILA